MSEKLYELRKDISTPGSYMRAGERKTEKQWKELFGLDNPFDWYKEWFIDLSVESEKEPIDEIRDVVNDIFDKQGLRSISYKEAAVMACKKCLAIFK